MLRLSRSAVSSLFSGKRPAFSYSSAAALCDSVKESGPVPVTDQQATVEAPRRLKRPAEIMWQPKIANSVRMIGSVGSPVHFDVDSDGKCWAAAVLVQQKSDTMPRFRIALLFEADLAQMAVCHLKEKDLICVSGQISGNPPPLPFEDFQPKIQIVVKNVDYVKIVEKMPITLDNVHRKHYTTAKRGGSAGVKSHRRQRIS